MRLYDSISDNDNINSYDRRIANVSIRLIVDLIKATRIR